MRHFLLYTYLTAVANAVKAPGVFYISSSGTENLLFHFFILVMIRSDGWSSEYFDVEIWHLIYKMSSLNFNALGGAEIYLSRQNTENLTEWHLAFSPLTRCNKGSPVHGAKEVIIIVMIGGDHLITLRNPDSGLADVGKVVPEVIMTKMRRQEWERWLLKSVLYLVIILTLGTQQWDMRLVQGYKPAT